jgi:hypothetical protein
MANDSKPRSRRRFIKTTTGISLVGITGLAGCTGGGDGGGTTESPETTSEPDETDTGGGSNTTEDDSPDLDFEGQEISVKLNLGGLATWQREVVIPRVEEKYNLVVNDEQTTTGPMVSEIKANPDNPPDVVDINPNGVWELNRNDHLATFADYPDILTNYGDIYDGVKYFDDTGVGWMLQEVMPIINTNGYDSDPQSWQAVVDDAGSIAIPPFSWTQGLMLLMASAIATGEDYSSSSLDAEAGFDWIRENMKPKTYTVINGQSQAKQLVSQGQVDALIPTWDSWLLDMFKNDAPVQGARRIDPNTIDATQTYGVPRNGNVEAAMAYVNEALSVYAQEPPATYTGCGITNENAEMPQEVLDLGIDPVTGDDLDSLKRPDYRFMWENQDQWSETWNEIYTA